MMSTTNIFQYVKDNIRISEFVEATGRSKGLNRVGDGEYRTNNIIAQGDNPNAMRIMDDDGFFTVFSHGQERGDIIELYRLLFDPQGDNKAESALKLAQYMNLDVPDELINKKYKSTRSLLQVTNKITDKTHSYLMTSQNRDAIIVRKYLKEDRQVTDDIIREWKIGLFPEDQHECLSMMKQCANLKDLQSVGVIKNTTKPFVSMHGRLSFPIFNMNGDTIAFSSRKIDRVQSFSEGKYINTSSTELYDKSKNLYGQHLFNTDTHNVIICEGNLDVIALNEIYKDDPHTIALATCGTALTDGHAHIIKRKKIKNISLLFDSDTAGKEAAIKTIFLVNYFDNVNISSIQKGKDPWDAFTSGYNIKQRIFYGSSLIVDAVKLAYDLYGESDKMLQWIKYAYSILSMSYHKEELVEQSYNIAHIRKNTVRKVVNGVNHKDKKSRSDDKISLSGDIMMIIQTLLTFSKKERMFICAPMLFFKNDKLQYILELLGSDSVIEDDALLSVLDYDVDDNIRDYAYNFNTVSDEDKDSIRIIFLQNIARKIIDNWRTEGIPCGGNDYISILHHISSGAIGQNLLQYFIFIFDIIVISAMRSVKN